MKLYVCTDHDFHWPTGVASVIIAKNEDEAKELLNKALVRRGLQPYDEKPYVLHEISQKKSSNYIIRWRLLGGNYGLQRRISKRKTYASKS